MILQLLSDLHMETEDFEPEPAPQAELLVLAGDIDSTWAGWERFRGWPVPVIAIAGNHEFDGREIRTAWPAFRDRCAALSITLLECESRVLTDRQGQRVRFVGTTRWCDFDLFGPAQRAKAMRAATYYMRVMRSTRDGQPYDPAAVREDALACRAWLSAELARAPGRSGQSWDQTVVLTHFGPSLRSADPRYGDQPGTASFCNADDELLPHAALWLHGHLHCRHDYRVVHLSGRQTRVVCNARGHVRRGEADGHDALLCVQV